MVYSLPDGAINLTDYAMYFISRLTPWGWVQQEVTWNDQISSVKANKNIADMWWDINKSGSIFPVQYTENIPNLGTYGWNDKVSSIDIACCNN